MWGPYVKATCVRKIHTVCFEKITTPRVSRWLLRTCICNVADWFLAKTIKLTGLWPHVHQECKFSGRLVRFVSSFFFFEIGWPRRMHQLMHMEFIKTRSQNSITDHGSHKVSTWTSHLKRPNKVQRKKIMKLSVSRYASSTGRRNPVLPFPDGCTQYTCLGVAPPAADMTTYESNG
jgi:hypothetical protein